MISEKIVIGMANDTPFIKPLIILNLKLLHTFLLAASGH